MVETIAEDLVLKQALFRSLDERVPAHIPIGSNSSAYPISKIAEGLKTAERMMGAHYFMPAEVVPLVEIVMGEKTELAHAQHVCELYKSVNKKPVLVKKDIPGFLANRIQHALMREALHLIDAGIASPEDVDDAVRYSFGFRYAAVGPITQKELSGWDVSCHSAKEIYPTLCNSNAIPQSILDMVIAGKSGVKTMQGYWQWTPEKVKALKAIYSKRLKAAFAVPPTSKKLAGFPPDNLMISIVAIAKPAPFTIQATLPSNFTKFNPAASASTSVGSSSAKSRIAK